MSISWELAGKKYPISELNNNIKKTFTFIICIFVFYTRCNHRQCATCYKYNKVIIQKAV